MVKSGKYTGICRRNFVVFFLMLAFLTFMTFKLNVFQWSFNIRPSEINTFSQKINRTFRIAWYPNHNYEFNGYSTYDPTECDVRDCFLEENTTVADIVILHHRGVSSNRPIKKEKNQIWVLYSGESPYHSTHPSPQWAKHIDLCASYMEFSDFFVPLYGRVVPREAGPTRNFTGILRNKTKDVVWVSSHCSTPAKRENPVKELSHYLQVDMFGSCGTKKCGKQYDDLKQCEAIFVNNYKFYFAFENSICDNYTTEKLYSLFRDRSPIIPVINGPRDVGKYLPKGTYINRFDFASPKKFAGELKRIGNNESEYIRILQEKDKYMLPVNHVEKTFHKLYCDQCKYLQKLYDGKIKNKTRSWQRIYDKNLLCIPGM